jgi:hypothetical protein
MLTRTYRGIERKGLLRKVEAGEHTAGAVGEFLPELMEFSPCA